eukprot:gnl/Chilomastix_cuspidata/2154.p1 GENE.gnl/Chilomastix_cuspidata/2154~~gnl/Chilomastix_cuspidata/2154.p1  ORF type:complete len:273 (-),score=110.48 gnl/Chilomastix_cuspidata/2154:407-1225(-)
MDLYVNPADPYRAGDEAFVSIHVVPKKKVKIQWIAVFVVGYTTSLPIPTAKGRSLPQKVYTSIPEPSELLPETCTCFLQSGPLVLAADEFLSDPITHLISFAVPPDAPGSFQTRDLLCRYETFVFVSLLKPGLIRSSASFFSTRRAFSVAAQRRGAAQALSVAISGRKAGKLASVKQESRGPLLVWTVATQPGQAVSGVELRVVTHTGAVLFRRAERPFAAANAATLRFTAPAALLAAARGAGTAGALRLEVDIARAGSHFSWSGPIAQELL